MRIIAISDTHGKHEALALPDGDVLVVAGGFTKRGGHDELRTFNAWLGSLPHRHKVVVAGNHEFACEKLSPADTRKILYNAVYLQDSAERIDGVLFYGSPWQPEFGGWAFNLPRGRELAKRWAQIPPETDVLITHGPPFGVLDVVSRGAHVGCEDLLLAVLRVRPAVHIFGHIHESYGTVDQYNAVGPYSERIRFFAQNAFSMTRFFNAAVCDEFYAPCNPPQVIDI